MRGLVVRMLLAVAFAFLAGLSVYGRGSILWPSIASVSFLIGALLKMTDGGER